MRTIVLIRKTFSWFGGSDICAGIMDYKIQLLWDNDASVWVATSPDVPGLVLESGSFDALIERVRYAIPELLELNRQKAPFYNLTFLSERRERVVVNG